jgi:Uma2 family endonuclease
MSGHSREQQHRRLAARRAALESRLDALLRLAPLCPDLVVELASPSDEGPRGLSALRSKMATYQANEVWLASGDPQ